MRTVGALEARYADDHVPLALVLGALGALSAVRTLLPDGLLAHAALPANGSSTDAGVRSEPEAFVALLLGAVATHDRLLALFGPALAAHSARDSEAKLGGDLPQRLGGLLR